MAGAPLDPFSVAGARAATLSCLGSPLAADAAAGSAAVPAARAVSFCLRSVFPLSALEAVGGGGRPTIRKINGSDLVASALVPPSRGTACVFTSLHGSFGEPGGALVASDLGWSVV